MNILIDTTEFNLSNPYSSIPRYVFRFLSAIQEKERKEYTLLINEGCEEYFRSNYPEFAIISCRLFGYRYWLGKNPFVRYSRYKIKSIIKNGHFDVIFIPSDRPVYMYGNLGCRKVNVIHDLKGIKRNCKNWAETFKAYHFNKLYGDSIMSSDDVIAISKYTRQDILVHYPNVDATKIKLVYNSVTIANTSVCPHGFCENDYILYVNTISDYKGIDTLLQAYNIIADKVKKKLVVVGKKNIYWENRLVPFIRKCKLEDNIIQLQNLTDGELRYVYEHASIFVTPSLNEGFGYTPIEAAVCHCPVVSSISESLPDVTRGLVKFYYPAKDEQALAMAIVEMIENRSSEAELQNIADYYMQIYAPERQAEYLKSVIKGDKSCNLQYEEFCS